MGRMKLLMVIAALLPIAALFHAQLAVAGQGTAAAKADAVLNADQVGSKLFPDKVFFGGQVATVQARNTGGIHFGDGAYALAALVDSSGYSTDLRQKYQGYLLTQVTLEIQGQKLPAGAYGFGFLSGGKFVVMDLGARDLFQANSSQDAELKRPVPLQMTATSTVGKFRLYTGRDFIELQRAK